ncbi:fatty acid desaturase-domain-containing protein [Delphinella strobiligena]|nr:fatty acid desaturase-domain-containing protein [Delphinella strobiligena]
MASQKIIAACEIEALINKGQTIVIYEGYALRLDAWLDKHPGGRLAILHMVGRDATDEINVYHFAKTLRLIKAYRIGKIQHPWVNMEPPIRASAQKTAVTGMDIHAGKEHKSNHINEKGDTEQQYTASPSHLTRDEEIEAIEQREIDEGIAAWPSLDAETQRNITLEYRALHEQVKLHGLYNCRYSEYGKEMIRYSILFTAFLVLLRAEWYLTSAIFLGMFWQQIMFVAHDAGHRGITGDFVYDTLIAAFVADFSSGLSIGWWKSSHNVHHLVTNMPEHDPDLQNVPIFSTSPAYFKSVLSTFYNIVYPWDGVADVLIPIQKYTYYPIMALARFNLYFLSWCHLLSPRAKQLGSAWWIRPVEIAFMICYWWLFGYKLVWCTLPTWPIRIAFVLLSHISTMLLHVQITLSHWGMPTADLGPSESFPQRQLRTTMDVDCPPWLDFLHGGLQFQAVHHLFPRVPRHNLRKVQGLVREFCGKTELRYQIHGFVEGNGVVLSKLDEVAKMVDTLVQCQKYMAETGESGLH